MEELPRRKVEPFGRSWFRWLVFVESEANVWPAQKVRRRSVLTKGSFKPERESGTTLRVVILRYDSTRRVEPTRFESASSSVERGS